MLTSKTRDKVNWHSPTSSAKKWLKNVSGAGLRKKRPQKIRNQRKNEVNDREMKKSKVKETRWDKKDDR